MSADQVHISDSNYHELFSTHVKDTFAIKVALPRTYSKTKRDYPVIIVLDANVFFGITSDTARLLYFGQEIPDAVVVGIGYPNDDEHMLLRNRDYLPTQNDASLKSGHAKEFLEFLKVELIPFVQQNYKVKSSNLTLVGDSYSGLFALYTLFSAPDTFKNYVIGSPSIYWDNKVIFEIEKKYSNIHKALHANIFLSVGELEASQEPKFANMVGNVLDMSQLLNDRAYEGLSLVTHVFQGESHMSVIPATISRGLREVFK